MRIWRLVIVVLGLTAMLVPCYIPLNHETTVIRMFIVFFPYIPPDLILLWIADGIIVSLLLLSLSDEKWLNNRQRILLRAIAFAVFVSILFLPLQHGQVTNLFRHLRFLYNDIDSERMMVIWISIGLASQSLFQGFSNALWRRGKANIVSYIGALLFLIIGFFPARDGGMYHLPHWINSVTDDEGDWRMSWAYLIMGWTAIAMVINMYFNVSKALHAVYESPQTADDEPGAAGITKSSINS